MKISLRILNFSAWIALLMVIIAPGRANEAGIQRTEYGFPFRFVVQFQHEMPEGQVWLLHSMRIDLLYFALNVLMIYAIIHGLTYLTSMLRNTSRKK